MELMRAIGLYLDRPLAVVQFRTFFDERSLHKTIIWRQNEFWSCVDTLFGDMLNVSSWNASVFFTSDSAELRVKAKERLSRYGRVAYNDVKIEHTAHISVRISHPLLEWLVMGWGCASVTTATSFANTAMFRAGAETKSFSMVYLFKDANTRKCISDRYSLS